MKKIDVVFDGPPGPYSGRFVEVEDENGHGIQIGSWIHRADGFWALRIPLKARIMGDKGNFWLGVAFGLILAGALITMAATLYEMIVL